MLLLDILDFSLVSMGQIRKNPKMLYFFLITFFLVFSMLRLIVPTRSSRTRRWSYAHHSADPKVATILRSKWREKERYSVWAQLRPAMTRKLAEPGAAVHEIPAAGRRPWKWIYFGFIWCCKLCSWASVWPAQTTSPRSAAGRSWKGDLIAAPHCLRIPKKYLRSSGSDHRAPPIRRMTATRIERSRI